MSFRTHLGLFVTLTLIFAPLSWGKRLLPPEVQPVSDGPVEYRAPHRQMGFIEAWDVEADQLLWLRQIYVVKHRLDLERDVQDVFIVSLELENGYLLLTNERSSTYKLNLDSLEVEVIEGTLMEAIE